MSRAKWTPKWYLGRYLYKQQPALKVSAAKEANATSLWPTELHRNHMFSGANLYTFSWIGPKNAVPSSIHLMTIGPSNRADIPYQKYTLVSDGSEESICGLDHVRTKLKQLVVWIHLHGCKDLAPRNKHIQLQVVPSSTTTQKSQSDNFLIRKTSHWGTATNKFSLQILASEPASKSSWIHANSKAVSKAFPPWVVGKEPFVLGTWTHAWAKSTSFLGSLTIPKICRVFPVAQK